MVRGINILALLLSCLPALGVQFNSFTNKFSYFVDPNGNNSRAIAGIPEMPWSTVTAALNAASTAATGTNTATVIVFPGNYSENNLLRPSVNIFGYPGANLIYVEPSVVSEGYGLFDDRGCGATTNNVTWLGDMKYSGGTNGTVTFNTYNGNPNVLGSIVTTNPLTELHFRGVDNYSSVYVQSLSPANIYLQNCSSNSTFVFDNLLDFQGVVTKLNQLSQVRTFQSVCSGIVWIRGSGVVTINGLINPGGIASLLSGSTETDPTAPVAFYLRGSARLSKKIYTTWASTNYSMFLNFDEIDSGTNAVSPLDFYGSGNVDITCKTVKTAGEACFDQHDDGAGHGLKITTIRADRFINTGTNESWGWVNTGSIDLNVNRYEDWGGTITNGFRVFGGTLNINGGRATTAMAGANGVVISSGTLSLNGVVLDCDAVNNATGNPVDIIGTPTVTIRNSLLLSPALAESINASVAVNVGVYGSAGKTGKNANVTLSPNGGFTVDSAVQ